MDILTLGFLNCLFCIHISPFGVDSALACVAMLSPPPDLSSALGAATRAWEHLEIRPLRWAQAAHLRCSSDSSLASSGERRPSCGNQEPPELSSFFYQITEAPEMQVCSLVISLNWRWSLDRTTYSVRNNHLRLPRLLCKYRPSWPGSDPTPALFDPLALRVSVPWLLGTQ